MKLLVNLYRIWQAKAMNSNHHKTAMTLVEILIVVAVIGILAAISVGIAARIDNKAKEQLTENTIAILTAALAEFRDYGYRYADPDLSGFDFPLDCNDFEQAELEAALGSAFGAVAAPSITGDHKAAYSGCEALYFFLGRVPESRKVLDEIDGSLITNEGSDKKPMYMTIDEKPYPLLRVIDPWGTTLRYDYYVDWEDYRNAGGSLERYLTDRSKSRRSFPVITSAGPDRLFGTPDDITGR